MATDIRSKMRSNEEIVGRVDLDDPEAILSITTTEETEAIHAVQDNAEAIFTWDYEKGARPALNKLYEKAKGSQWNGETDLDWSIDVDIEKVVRDQSKVHRNNRLNGSRLPRLTSSTRNVH